MLSVFAFISYCIMAIIFFFIPEAHNPSGQTVVVRLALCVIVRVV